MHTYANVTTQIQLRMVNKREVISTQLKYMQTLWNWLQISNAHVKMNFKMITGKENLFLYYHITC